MAEQKYLNDEGLQHVLEAINTKFEKKEDIDAKLQGKSDVGHNHNEIYYTETEINTMLGNKSDVGHSHTTHLTTIIDANKNLDTLTTPGWYKCSASNASTLLNCPTTYAFSMEILSNDSCTQIIYESGGGGNPKIYVRTQSGDSTWSSWNRVYTTADSIEDAINTKTQVQFIKWESGD